MGQPGTTWRRRLQERIGLLDPTLHYTMDCDYWLRASKATRLHFIPRHMANLRIHEAAKSTDANEHFFIEEHLALGRRHGADKKKSNTRFKIFQLQRMARILRYPANWPRIFQR